MHRVVEPRIPAMEDIRPVVAHLRKVDLVKSVQLIVDMAGAGNREEDTECASERDLYRDWAQRRELHSDLMVVTKCSTVVILPHGSVRSCYRDWAQRRQLHSDLMVVTKCSTVVIIRHCSVGSRYRDWVQRRQLHSGMTVATNGRKVAVIRNCSVGPFTCTANTDKTKHRYHYHY